MRYVLIGGPETKRRIVARRTTNTGKDSYLGIAFLHQLALHIEQGQPGFVEMYQDRDVLAQGQGGTIIATPEGQALLKWSYDWFYATGSTPRDRLVQSIMREHMTVCRTMLPL